MVRAWTLIVALGVLSYGFWTSSDFKTIAAGVSIFLFGMLFLEEGFTAFTGGILEKALKSSTDKTWKSLLFGVTSTTLMQSSSLVSVITITFLSAGLIDLASGIGIIFGANLGTTTGAWLMAGFGMKVKISAYAMPMLVFGLVLSFQSHKGLRGAGKILAGLGFLFLGIHYMKEGFEAFKATIDLTQFAVEGYLGEIIFLLIGIAATVIMQSSHATLMLILAALASHQISYENALSLAIGANIGTTVTAIMGSLSANIEGKRLAVAHLIFNSVTAILAIVLMGQFIWLVDHISVWFGIAADNWTLKLAVFHTIFNLLGVVLMTPLIPRLVHFLNTRINAGLKRVNDPKYLNEAALQLPDTALNVLVLEVNHLYGKVYMIMAHGLSLHRKDIHSARDIRSLVIESNKPFEIDVKDQYYGIFKNIYNKIIEFSTHAMKDMDNDQIQELYDQRQACRQMAEAIKEIAEMQDNIAEYITSDNGYIRDEYNHLRIQLACIMREIDQLKKYSDESEILFKMDELKESIQENDVATNGTIDQLVRKQLITLEMATSLINDSAITYSVSKRLLRIANTILIPKNSELYNLKKELLRSVHDFKEKRKHGTHKKAV